MLGLICALLAHTTAARAQPAQGSLLVAEFLSGTVLEVASTGDYSATPRFATGLSTPVELCIGPGGDVYVSEYDAGEVTIITQGGDFTAAPAFATGVPSAAALACTSDRILVANLDGGLVYDITAGGDFSSAQPFATLTGVEGLNAMTITPQGRVFAAAHQGVWDITNGGTFDVANLYATFTSNQWGVMGFAHLGPTLYVSLENSTLVPLQRGADLGTVPPFATLPMQALGLGGASNRIFAATGSIGGAPSPMAIYDITAGGDLTSAPPFATGIGLTIFNSILYYGSCGDGTLEHDDGERCDDGVLNSDSEPDACRSDCRPARCGDGVVDSTEQCDDGSVNGQVGACPLDCRFDQVLVIGTEFAGAEGSCSDGGTRLEIGIDRDGSGSLSHPEVSQVRYVCNGAPGAQGESGPQGNEGAMGATGHAGESGPRGAVGATGATEASGALGPRPQLRVSPVQPGSEACPAGGIRLEAGADDNGNGSLDDDEVSSTAISCTAGAGLVRARTLEPGSSGCASGGVLIESGVDANGDGVLVESEVQQRQAVCQGAGASLQADGSDGIVAAGGSSCSVRFDGHRSGTSLSFCILGLALALLRHRTRRAGAAG